MTLEALGRLQLFAGLVGSVALAAVVLLWRLIRLRVAVFPPQERDGTRPWLPDRDSKLRQHVRWLVELRWIAGSTALLVVLLAVPVAGLLALTSFL